MFAAAATAACSPSDKPASEPATKASGSAPHENVASSVAKPADPQRQNSNAPKQVDTPKTKPPPATLLSSVALLGSGTDIPSYNRTIAIEPSFVPPGNVGGGEGGPAPRQYLAMVGAEETRRMRMALAGAKTEIRADCFVVAFEVNAPSSAVVLTVAKDGSIERRFPPSSKPDAPNRFEPGATHVLPRAIVALTPESERIDAIDFEPGYRVSAGTATASGDVTVTVIFALTSAPLERDVVGKLDALVAEIAGAPPAADASAKSSGRLEVWLAENGFAVRELRVRAP